MQKEFWNVGAVWEKKYYKAHEITEKHLIWQIIWEFIYKERNYFCFLSFLPYYLNTFEDTNYNVVFSKGIVQNACRVYASLKKDTCYLQHRTRSSSWKWSSRKSRWWWHPNNGDRKKINEKMNFLWLGCYKAIIHGYYTIISITFEIHTC